MPKFVPLSTIPNSAVEALLDAAFGTDRQSRTAYRLREGSVIIDNLSFAMLDPDQQLIGTVQCWPVHIADVPMVLVGPVAITPTLQNQGFGSRLMHSVLEAAAIIGDPPMVMIGDPEYYGRFGFTSAETGGWKLPGPWEPHRLLARNPAGFPLPSQGMLGPVHAL
jgi:predicted N-acetyltransferase YhbS